MNLFYKMLLIVAVIAAAVITYDLFQASAEGGTEPRIRFDPATGRVTLHKPDIRVRIVYASMFGPGEPVMRVRDAWISRFEEEYSDKLAAEMGVVIPADEKRRFVARTLSRAEAGVAYAGEAIRRIEATSDAGDRKQAVTALADYLAERDIRLMPLDPRVSTDDRLAALKQMVDCLSALLAADDPTADVDVRPRLVFVDRRWQGRWVLTANRPRFLTDRGVPDVINGSKMELFALVNDDYVVSLDDPLAGGTVSPLDSPDTWGDPSRSWREAFIAPMLAEGVYTFLDDETRRTKTYLAPLGCTTFPIFYNEVLFAKAGVKPPKTWPEFLQVCEKLKAAGVVPLTADADVYADMWQTWINFRVVGPNTWERTITGAGEGEARLPWTAAGYRDGYAAIRELREKGYFHKNFKGYKWPAAQRSFAKGEAGMMICGSWLYQELGGYKDLASADVFKLNCFMFPAWPAPEGLSAEALKAQNTLQRGCWARVSGMMICRQGKATPHAVELVKYLSVKDHPDLVHINGRISCMKAADFPPALKSIENDFKNASAVYSRTPNIYARRFNNQVLKDRYVNFFMKSDPSDSKHVTLDEFLETLEAESDKYLRNGGEEYYE